MITTTATSKNLKKKKKNPTLEISREKASNVSHPQRVN
jgi:hypothetical protein